MFSSQALLWVLPFPGCLWHNLGPIIKGKRKRSKSDKGSHTPNTHMHTHTCSARSTHKCTLIHVHTHFIDMHLSGFIGNFMVGEITPSAQQKEAAYRKKKNYPLRVCKRVKNLWFPFHFYCLFCFIFIHKHSMRTFLS